jgi:hypothetical protein
VIEQSVGQYCLFYVCRLNGTFLQEQASCSEREHRNPLGYPRQESLTGRCDFLNYLFWTQRTPYSVVSANTLVTPKRSSRVFESE